MLFQERYRILSVIQSLLDSVNSLLEEELPSFTRAAGYNTVYYSIICQELFFNKLRYKVTSAATEWPFASLLSIDWELDSVIFNDMKKVG